MQCTLLDCGAMKCVQRVEFCVYFNFGVGFCWCSWGLKKIQHSVKVNQYLFLFIQKVHLELEGHTAVQPSEFFHGDDGSTRIIVLRNEDIREHICEVIVLLIPKLAPKDLQKMLTFFFFFPPLQIPNLLMLKKLRGVRFAGIDEPDDVVNLTHQELFVKGGFVVFDRATLECLSPCMSILDS